MLGALGSVVEVVGVFFVCDAGGWAWVLRWHPRFVSVFLASPFGVAGLCAGIRVTVARFMPLRSVCSAFALASALR